MECWLPAHFYKLWCHLSNFRFCEFCPFSMKLNALATRVHTYQGRHMFQGTYIMYQGSMRSIMIESAVEGACEVGLWYRSQTAGPGISPPLESVHHWNEFTGISPLLESVHHWNGFTGSLQFTTTAIHMETSSARHGLYILLTCETHRISCETGNTEQAIKKRSTPR